MKCRNRHSIFTLVLLICAAIVAFGLWTAAIAETPQWPKQEDGCYLIATSSDLAKFRDAVNGGSADISAKLTADTDLEGSETNQWDPIGTISIDKLDASTPFTGVFDGNGHAITGLYISSDQSFQGLFGSISGDAEVKDLTVSGDVRGHGGIGIIAGFNFFGGNETNCTATGNVSSTAEYVGGIVGLNRGGTVANCTATCDVNGLDTGSAGGIIGYNSGTVENCAATGDVSGKYSVGGVVGCTEGGTVINCAATGDVSGTQDSVGGIIGDNSGTVENCAATGDVSITGNSGYNYVGGIVGHNSGTVENCAATGSVSCTGNSSEAGGIIGHNSGTVENCGWLTSCADTGIGGDDGVSKDVVSFDSAENIVVACLPDPMSVTLKNGETKAVTMRAWPAGRAVTAYNLAGGITAEVSPDIAKAAAAADAGVFNITGTASGKGLAKFTLSMKPTWFNKGCSSVSTDVKLTPAALLTVTERAATPTASPAGGAYTEAQSVTLSCATAGAKIYYTTDGSAPTEKSTLYASAITVNKTTTIKAISVADNLGTSGIMTEEYTIDGSPTPGGGSGGCNAGGGALLLLAAVPFVVKQKKRNK